MLRPPPSSPQKIPVPRRAHSILTSAQSSAGHRPFIINNIIMNILLDKVYQSTLVLVFYMGCLLIHLCHFGYMCRVWRYAHRQFFFLDIILDGSLPGQSVGLCHFCLLLCAKRIQTRFSRFLYFFSYFFIIFTHISLT